MLQFFLEKALQTWKETFSKIKLTAKHTLTCSCKQHLKDCSQSPWRLRSCWPLIPRQQKHALVAHTYISLNLESYVGEQSARYANRLLSHNQLRRNRSKHSRQQDNFRILINSPNTSPWLNPLISSIIPKWISRIPIRCLRLPWDSCHVHQKFTILNGFSTETNPTHVEAEISSPWSYLKLTRYWEQVESTAWNKLSVTSICADMSHGIAKQDGQATSSSHLFPWLMPGTHILLNGRRVKETWWSISYDQYANCPICWAHLVQTLTIIW